jgi:hypothetical protein
MKRAAVLPFAVLLLVAGCESGGDGASSSAGGARAATCTDPVGDGGAADLTAVEVTETGDGLEAAFTLAAPLDTTTGTQVLSLLVSSRDGKTAKQFGAKWIDGTPLVFVFDFGSGGQQIVQAEPRVDGATIDLAFPSGALDGLGDTWNWRADTNVAGSDVDACPDAGADPADPQQQTFPG